MILGNTETPKVTAGMFMTEVRLLQLLLWITLVNKEFFEGEKLQEKI